MNGHHAVLSWVLSTHPNLITSDDNVSVSSDNEGDEPDIQSDDLVAYSTELNDTRVLDLLAGAMGSERVLAICENLYLVWEKEKFSAPVLAWCASRGMQICADEFHALMQIASKNGKIDWIEMYLKMGATWQPLYFDIAVRNDHLELCKWIFDRRAELPVDMTSVITRALHEQSSQAMLEWFSSVGVFKQFKTSEVKKHKAHIKYKSAHIYCLAPAYLTGRKRTQATHINVKMTIAI